MSRAHVPSGLKVKRWYAPESKSVFKRVEHILSTADVRPFAKGVVNVVGGMLERVFYLDGDCTRPPPCIRPASDLWGLTNQLASAVGVCHRVSGSEFIATRSGAKRAMYERARSDLFNKPCSLDALSRLSFFTKWESTMHGAKIQVPRIVSPRSFGFNYLLGRYMRPIEHPIFDALATLFGTSCVVAKGLTQEAKGQMIADKMQGKVAVGLDASRFDQTIGRTLLTVEHALYEKLFPGDKLLPALLKKQLTNKGVARCRDGMVSANIGAMRCSGDQNTSLGNCIISCLLAKLFFEEHGIIDGDVFNDGDDLIMFIPAQSLPKLVNLQTWYLNWGLRMKVEPVAHEPEQVEFCQSRPVWTPRGYVLVRNVRKAFNTDYAGNERVDKWCDYLTHLRNVGLCGMSMAAGIPLYQEFYQFGIRNGKTGKQDSTVLGGMGYQAKIQRRAGCLSTVVPVDPMTRDSFALAFGISAADQLSIEEWFKTATLGCQDDAERNIILNPYSIALN